MRTWPFVLAVAACQAPSNLDIKVGGSADQLWDLAPDGTEVGVVATPRAIGLVLDGITAAQKLFNLDDFAPMRTNARALIGAILGTPDATPESAGLARDKGFAMFITPDGVLGVIPVGDRDKFMATKHGKRGEIDELSGNTCKPIKDNYVCATNPKLFDQLGTKSLKGKASTLAGGHGDIEVYATQLPLFDGEPADVAVAIGMQRGQLDVRATWTGKPVGMLAALSGTTVPKPNVTNASGFVAVDVSKLVTDLPPFPLAGDVTFDRFAKSLAGPVTATIPAGSVDIQITAPVTDVAPAKTVLDNCPALGQILDLAPQQPKDACRFRMQAASMIELEAWVDEAAKAIRVGSHRAAPATAITSALTPIGKELATGDWTAVFWGRGTLLNLTGVTPTTQDVPPAGSAALHAISLVNELGLGIQVGDQGVHVRGVLRTVWTNPAAVVDKIVAVTGNDILKAKATATGQAIATEAPDSPFAADFAAGQGGLMVPAAAMGIASAIILPLFDSLLSTEPQLDVPG
ncbi:MAG: hypothetical protein QM831_16535 [Kofleriaceae bacterium]